MCCTLHSFLSPVPALQTHIHRSRPPPSLPPRGGRESFSFSVPSHALRVHAMGDVTKRAFSPPSPRAPSLVPPPLLPAKSAPVGLALAYPACSRTSAQPAHSRLPGPRVALTPHPRRSETPALPPTGQDRLGQRLPERYSIPGTTPWARTPPWPLLRYRAAPPPPHRLLPSSPPPPLPSSPPPMCRRALTKWGTAHVRLPLCPIPECPRLSVWPAR